VLQFVTKFRVWICVILCTSIRFFFSSVYNAKRKKKWNYDHHFGRDKSDNLYRVPGRKESRSVSLVNSLLDDITCVRVKGQVQSPPTPTHLVGSKPISHHMFLIIEILSWMIKICCKNVLTKNLLVTTTGSLGFERERSTKTTLVKLVICKLSLIISIDK
jgi:hypothetical protein